MSQAPCRVGQDHSTGFSRESSSLAEWHPLAQDWVLVSAWHGGTYLNFSMQEAEADKSLSSKPA